MLLRLLSASVNTEILCSQSATTIELPAQKIVVMQLAYESYYWGEYRLLPNAG